MSAEAPRRTLDKLAGSIDDALELIDQFSRAPRPGAVAEGPASLLEQCVELCAQLEERAPEPVRTVHQLACTGGTVICKGIAAMANVQLLSEADPLSTLGRSRSGEPRFAPAELATLAQQSTRGTRPELVAELFLAGLGVLYADCVGSGQRLVVRDHAHSHFCVGEAVPARPTLRSIVAARFPVRSVVSVRHPLDAYLSLQAAGWLHFTPPGIEEYCRRTLAFLDAHAGVEVVRYEDFVATPAAVMERICQILELPFSEQFLELLDVFRLTGDSGRSGGAVAPRPRRKIGGQLAGELECSPAYAAVLARLGYEQ